jgi:hypothetical protein
MAEHKHAAVLRAIADKGFEAAQGGVVGPKETVWMAAAGAWNPLTHPYHEWRIKPEPKPDVVRYVNIYSNGVGGSYANPTDAAAGSGDCRVGVIRYVFDGETGKLKSAEVLP